MARFGLKENGPSSFLSKNGNGKDAGIEVRNGKIEDQK
jgi:hypothetical protein